jgi:hypothetical protein
MTDLLCIFFITKLCRNEDDKTLPNLIKEKACIQKGKGRNKKRRATNRQLPKSKTQTAVAKIYQKKLQGGPIQRAYQSSHIFQATDLHEISGYIK